MEANRGPSERLGMLDAHGHRQFIIPAEVRGFFKTWKTRVHFVLMLIFLGLPWLPIGGSQAILIDIPNRQFHFFGLHLFAYDAPLIFFLLAIGTMGLALVTALWGRVWCGWACPQTVFIEAVYRRIEILVEGNYLERRKLQQEDWSFRKLQKTGLKWILYFAVSSLFAHSFIAYFTGSSRLLDMISGRPSENMTYFALVTGMTLLLLFNFGWFREQFCLIACPYGRIQSVLLDSQSVTVMYDSKRGEPRKGGWVEGQARGDCVSCNRCVQVCPTGIDIRNGLQFECIACTACVDACDEIMTKVKKPTGLIRYKALSEEAVNWFRPRVLIYGGLVAAAAIALTTLLVIYKPIRVEVLRAKNTPYFVTSEGKVRNQFVIRMENHLAGEAKLKILSNSAVQLIIPQNPVTVAANQKQEIPVFVEISLTELHNGRFPAEIEVWQEGEEPRIISLKRISILGPQVQGDEHEK